MKIDTQQHDFLIYIADMLVVLVLTLIFCLVTTFAHADMGSGSGGSVSARLSFAVKIHERISLSVQENDGGGDVRATAVVGPNATVALNEYDGVKSRSVMRRNGGGSYQGAVVQNDEGSGVYTVASP